MTVSVRLQDGDICEVADVRAAGAERAAIVVNHTGMAIDFKVHGPGWGVIEIKKAEKTK